MAATMFTEEQSAAIAERKKTLLLSAAAGSGKTATLTERIIVSLTDRESPADISRMLIVTFTRAAAAELRERIEAAVRRALENDPHNRHLQNQLLLVPTAEISTIDSFCSRIVKMSAETLGISPAFRVPDEAEAELLRRSTMEDLIAEGYEGALPFVTAEGFISFCEEIAGVRRDRDLAPTLLKVYEDTSGFGEGCGVFTRYAEMQQKAAETPFFESPYGKRIAELVGEFIDHYEAAYNAVAAEAALEDPAYSAVCQSDLSVLADLRNALMNGYDAVRALAPEGLRLMTFPRIKGEKPAVDSVIRGIRDRMKRDYAKKCQPNFTYSAEECVAAFRRAARFSALFASVMQEFERRYGEEKRRRSLCDYADLERYTYDLLLQNGAPTPLALAIREGYDFVYIDEYQDTNSMQDAIFSAIGKKNNRFLVGDVKQSIYSFRGAEPSIFANMKRVFPPIEAGEGCDAVTVNLSQNFRCDQEVIDFTNAVFDRIFGVAGESIAYVASDRLAHGKRGSENHVPVTVALFPPRDIPKTPEELFPSEEELLSTDPELRYIASEVVRLLRDGKKNDGTPIRPGDIAVILRSAKSSAALVAASLRRAGVAVTAETDRSFFLSPEILLAVSLLSAIDNPEKDIPLAAALRSPIYGFTMDELIRIRLAADREDSLYAACLLYAEKNPEDEKIAAFLSSLAGFRKMAEGVTVDRLLSQLYAETGLLSLAGRGTEGEQNLRLLYDYARRFEGSAFRGLYSFLAYVNELIAEGKSLPKEPASDKTDAVHVMTVHHSKGLEYPVVFLARAGTPYNRNDSRVSLVFSPELGVATRFRDPSGLALVDTPVRKLTLDRIYELQKEEEMRLLYVACTRARERLYITGKALPTSSVAKTLENGEHDRRFFSRYIAKNVNSYLSAVLATVDLSAPYVSLVVPEGDGEAPAVAESTVEGSGKTASVTPEELRRRYDFVYPYAAVSRMPGKISVSRLYPTLLDEVAEEETALPVPAAATSAPPASAADAAKEEEAPPRIPDFMQEERAPGGARRGTATHLFFQFADYGHLLENGAESECRRLYENGFLTREDAEMVYIDEIEAFLSSELFRELRAARAIRRELRFHAGLPAAAFTSEASTKAALAQERLFMQGVIDCVIERRTGDYLLVDYKTDRPTPYERANPAAFRKALRERHTLQLSYYTAAVTEIFGAPPAKVLIYATALGESIEVEPIPIE